MASSSDNISMAVFCDFENVALGVRDANYEKFDIQPVLERLLLKGSIVVKKAYCDWERYKGFKAAMHESNFELIEIPHVRQSGKNSADIRLVVDALDLCYTKSHVNTFVIISGDSDFSPLVSKLRENNKHVIAVGVKQSTSDLLVANCDEFIFYDDLVREVKRTVAKREERKARPQAEKRPPSDESNRRKEELETRKALALEMVVETFDALISERGDSGKIWASLLKDTLKRRRPDFNESYFGFSTFGKLLEEAQTRGLLEFGRDEKSGAYVYRSQNAAAAIASDAGADEQVDAGNDEQVDAGTDEAAEPVEAVAAPVNARNNRPQQGRGQQERPRSRTSFRTPIVDTTSDDAPADEPVDEEDAQPVQPPTQNPRGRNRGRDRDRDRERQPVEAQAAAVADDDQAQPAQPQQEVRGEPRGRNRNNRNRQPGEGQPAVNAGDAQQTQPGQPKPPKQEGRNRGRNRDRVPADGQPNRDANRDRVPSEAQPKSHENALPPELRGRGRGRNGPRNQNAPRYPEASEELAFHKQQQALEAAAAAAGQADDAVSSAPAPAPAPVMNEEAVDQAAVAAPVTPVADAKPAASERRRAPRKTAAQKAAEAAPAVEEAVSAAEPVATAQPAAPATMDALPDASADTTAPADSVVAKKPARKPAARKAAAAPPAPAEPVADAISPERVADVAAEKPAARPRRAAKPKADPA
jgi:uncharacterized LabA/DUF88 family protein